jgi:hypothetical protein
LVTVHIVRAITGVAVFALHEPLFGNSLFETDTETDAVAGSLLVGPHAIASSCAFISRIAVTSLDVAQGGLPEFNAKACGKLDVTASNLRIPNTKKDAGQGPIAGALRGLSKVRP